MNIRFAVGRYLLVLVIAAGCGAPSDVTIRAAGIEPSLASTKKCAGSGGAYIVRYPASWFTVEHGPVPCRFFHPEPFALPESTEAPGLAIRVVLAPAPFDVIVPPLHGQGGFDETLSRRNGFLARHRTARIDSRTRSAGILPAGTRQLTWYVETGEETLVATTSDNASSGRFGSNADVLDAIVAAMEPRPTASPGGLHSDDEYNVVADAADTVAAQVLQDPIEHRADAQRTDMLSRLDSKSKMPAPHDRQDTRTWSSSRQGLTMAMAGGGAKAVQPGPRPPLPMCPKEVRMENVIALTFRGSDRARASLGALRRLHDAGDVRLRAVAIVERSEDRRPIVIDQAEDAQFTATASGGVIGGIIGLLGGPAGMLVGGATGAIVGSLVHIAEIESADAVLQTFASAVPRGHTATIAVVDEPAPAPINALASAFGVVPFRKSMPEVQFEIAEAQDAAITCRREDETKRTFGDQSSWQP